MTAVNDPTKAERLVVRAITYTVFAMVATMVILVRSGCPVLPVFAVCALLLSAAISCAVAGHRLGVTERASTEADR